MPRARDNRGMIFAYHQDLAARFPSLVTGLLTVRLPRTPLDVTADVARLEALARDRVADRPEAEWSPIRAWRAAFAGMGLKPTRYRCASEALLRRLRKDGRLPRLNALVDLYNAVSALHGIPVAAFDLARIAGDLTVRPASGDESYRPFAGPQETPAAGEIVFADTAGMAHARRWTNRQSAASAVSPGTRDALIVIEALHDPAEDNVTQARDAIASSLSRGRRRPALRPSRRFRSRTRRR